MWKVSATLIIICRYMSERLGLIVSGQERLVRLLHRGISSCLQRKSANPGRCRDHL